jgi:ABC-2 type transport system ATP-binding protein
MTTAPVAAREEEPALVARGLARRFGDVVAVRDFSLTVPSGAIYGLIGPNGAGKTTSLRMLATLLAPSDGEAWVRGRSIRDDVQAVRRQIGWMPDDFGVYPELRVSEYLDFYAACHGVPAARRAAVADDLLALVDLTHKRDAYVEGLSRGMQQRLGLARALVHDPSVLLLDEPASGLDPRARLELREVVRELGRLGKAVLISSHILAELADLCTHVAIVDGGRVLADGPIDAVARRLRGGRAVRVRALGQSERLGRLLSGFPGVHGVRLEPASAPPGPERAGDGQQPDPPPARAASSPEEWGTEGAASSVEAHVVLDGDERDLHALLAHLVAAGLPIYGFDQQAGGLEEVFLRVTRRPGDDGGEEPAP